MLHFGLFIVGFILVCVAIGWLQWWVTEKRNEEALKRFREALENITEKE